LGGGKDINSTRRTIWKRNSKAGVQFKHWHGSQEFYLYLGEKGQGQTEVCVDRDREM